MSSTRQIEYNTRSAGELLSCTNYLSLNNPSYRIFLGSFLVLAGIAMSVLPLIQISVPLSEVFFMFIGLVLLPFVANAFLVLGLVRDPRSCTTSLSAAGITDHTERENPINIPWNKIVSLRLNSGNVYFFAWRQSVYIPAYAFASREEAADFYNQALRHWHEARDKKIATKIASFDDSFLLETDTLSSIQEFDAHEEAIWTEMEEKHKKQQTSGSSDD